MNTQTIQTQHQENVCLVTLNRPSKKNALDKHMYEELTATLQTAESSKAIKAVVLTGQSGHFCAGNDLAEFKQVKKASDLSHIFSFLHCISTFNKPIIAAVEGVAIGIGTTMLLHCDLVYASSQSVFQLPFTQLGVCPEAGSSLLLPGLCGKQKASELLMLGEKFDAQTAKAIGIINQICEQADVLSMALEKANILARRSMLALLATKRLLREPYHSQLESSIALENELFLECLQSTECQSTISAFFASQKN